MTAIPDTATTVVRASHVPGPPQGQWTYAAYARLSEPDDFRYEIINGVLYMAPAPTPEHERIGAIIIGRLVAVVEDTSVGRVFISPDIDVGPNTLRPDAVVVLNTNVGVITANRLVGPPDLVIEIASPSTAAYDRDATEGKLGAYARIGIPEYWIVDPQRRSIDLFVLSGAAYALRGSYRGDDHLHSQVLPALVMQARQFFPHH